MTNVQMVSQALSPAISQFEFFHCETQDIKKQGSGNPLLSTPQQSNHERVAITEKAGGTSGGQVISAPSENMQHPTLASRQSHYQQRNKNSMANAAADFGGPKSESQKDAGEASSSLHADIYMHHERTSEQLGSADVERQVEDNQNANNGHATQSNPKNKSTFSKQLGSQESSVQESSVPRQMQMMRSPVIPASTKTRRPLNAQASGDSQLMGRLRDEISMLKARRNKKHQTAAQSQGKVTGRWTEEEHERFNEAIRLFGKNWKKVTQYVGSRISAQVRSHAQKVLKDYSPNSQYNKQMDDEDEDEADDDEVNEDADNSCAESSGAAQSDEVLQRKSKEDDVSRADCSGENYHNQNSSTSAALVQNQHKGSNDQKHLPEKRLLVGQNVSSAMGVAGYDEIQDCMLATPSVDRHNQNDQSQKRYRKSVERQEPQTSSVDDNGESGHGKRKRRRQDQFMSKIRVTQVAACSGGEFSQPAKRESDSCVNVAAMIQSHHQHESRSDYVEEFGSKLVVNPSQILDSRSTNGMILHSKNAPSKHTPPQISLIHSPTSPNNNQDDIDKIRGIHTSPRAAEDSGQAPDYDGPATPAFLCKQTAAKEIIYQQQHQQPHQQQQMQQQINTNAMNSSIMRQALAQSGYSLRARLLATQLIRDTNTANNFVTFVNNANPAAGGISAGAEPPSYNPSTFQAVVAPQQQQQSPILFAGSGGGNSSFGALQQHVLLQQQQQQQQANANAATSQHLLAGQVVADGHTPQGLFGLLAKAKAQNQQEATPVQIIRPQAIKAEIATQQQSQSGKDEQYSAAADGAVDESLIQIRNGLNSIYEKRVNLVRLIHEPCPDVIALQARKFQRINQEVLSFQTILGDVIDEFNNYFEGLQENQTTATALLEKEIRHRVRLFQIDIECLQIQVEQSNLYVAEQLRGGVAGGCNAPLRDQQSQVIATSNFFRKAGGGASGIQPTVTATATALHQEHQHPQELPISSVNMNRNAAQDSTFRANLASIMSGHNSVAKPTHFANASQPQIQMPTPLPGVAMAGSARGTTTPATASLMLASNCISNNAAGKNSTNAHQQSSQQSAANQQRSLTSLLTEFLSTSRTLNERSARAGSHRLSFDSQK